MYTFAKMCCLCLNNKCTLINYNDSDFDNKSAYDKLNHIIPALVSETNNKLPPWICIKCKEELDHAYIFYKKCQKSIYLLQSYNEKLQSVDNDSNLLPPPQDSCSLKIKISTKSSSVENVVPDKVENVVSDKEEEEEVKEDLFQEDTFLFDEIIAKISSFEYDNNLELLPIKEEIPDVDKTNSEVEKEETPDVVKKENTFLFDKNIADKSSLEKEDNQGFISIKEETDAGKNTSDADKNTSDADKNTSDANKTTSDANKTTSDADKSTYEALKEELNKLFDEDTLPFDGNSSESNISVVKNEINNEVFTKNEEKHHFDIFRNKSALGYVQSDSFTSIRTQCDNQAFLEKETINNQTEKVVDEQITNSSTKRRRRTRPVYYNEESEDEGRNYNDDSDFDPDLNLNNSMSDDNLSDGSASDDSEIDFSNQSAKKLKTSNTNCQRPKTNLIPPQTVVNHANTMNRMNYTYQNGFTNNVQPETRELSKNNQIANLNEENRRSLQTRTPVPAVVIHHLPKNSSNTDSFNSSLAGNILPRLLQTENSTIENIQTENRIPLNIVETPNLVTTSSSMLENNVLPSITTTNNVESNVSKPTKTVNTFRRKYVCNICRNKFKSSVELKEHMTSHEIVKLKEHMASHEIIEYKCKICFKLCANNNDLDSHMQEHNKQTPALNYQLGNIQNQEHPNNSQFSSTVTSRPPPPYPNLSETIQQLKLLGYLNHTLSKDGRYPVPLPNEIIEINSDGDEDYYMEKFFCNICNKKFEDFPKHMVIHQNENKAVCVYCDTTFPIKKQLFQHLRDVHCASEPICQICKETFKNIDLLFLHMYSHYGTEVHKCPDCEQLFLNASSKYLHLETDHKYTEFECYKCDQTFDSSRTITQHISTHESMNASLCHLCGRGFNSKKHLQRHIDNIHAPPEEYACKECGKKCPSRKRLNEHMEAKHENNTYECDICEKKLNTKKKLYLHRISHAEEKKRYVCGECGKKFRLKFMLKNHRRVHTGEKPFECKTCGKKFTQEVSLVVHNRIHTGEKPFTCEVCGKSYTQSYVYKMHLKKHHSAENQNTVVESKEK